MTTHEVLVAARNLIDRKGWSPYASGGPTMPEAAQCAGLACAAANGALGGVSLDASRALREVVGGDVYDWNDAPGRTKEEVLTAFDEAIAATAPPPADPFGVRETKAVFA